ncbi:CYTH domain-containing protein [bacterium]|jgi:adenylate cyclase, class 2|nr:CYTH domain-containing protein [bacterium]MBT4121462.1 CYTH domain-containing protein [bacterium]MBT4495461.1 CYTH domain-containing protein [bacterium]MBT4764259.1 CYTH domain-containing protein [bacterium]MBT5401631.1 CYTH domain-containing protein [bacterium]
MNIEYEITFPNINKADIRKRLKKAKAKLIRKTFLQKRHTYNLPNGHRVKHGWARVRNDGGQITLSIKMITGKKISDQKEICLNVDNYDDANQILQILGCKQKAYQETKRELWKLGSTEITIDEWPFLEPFIEIEGKSKKKVKEVVTKLDFNYNEGIIGAVDELYAKKYNISKYRINNKTPKIVFKMKNPFI